jgi:hypothetical protein
MMMEILKHYPLTTTIFLTWMLVVNFKSGEEDNRTVSMIGLVLIIGFLIAIRLGK